MAALMDDAMFNDAMISEMVSRFLAWPLPADFAPDGGITSARPNYAPEVEWRPVGTNLLTAAQAEAMIRHIIAHAEPPAIPEESFLSQLRRVNTDRYHAWVGDGQDAGILFDAAELGGEVGELLNVVKKLEREERGWRGSRAAPQDFADECADVLICLDKLSRRRGVDLEAATVAKFNATSDKVGLPHKLVSACKAAGDTGPGQ
jgi:NTP pyrophosphatase (non-canonical NTP hydrolase)